MRGRRAEQVPHVFVCQTLLTPALASLMNVVWAADCGSDGASPFDGCVQYVYGWMIVGLTQYVTLNRVLPIAFVVHCQLCDLNNIGLDIDWFLEAPIPS